MFYVGIILCIYKLLSKNILKLVIYSNKLNFKIIIDIIIEYLLLLFFSEDIYLLLMIN